MYIHPGEQNEQTIQQNHVAASCCKTKPDAASGFMFLYKKI